MSPPVITPIAKPEASLIFDFGHFVDALWVETVSAGRSAVDRGVFVRSECKEHQRMALTVAEEIDLDLPQTEPVLEKYYYDDDIVRKFVTAMFIWGVIAMLVGLMGRPGHGVPVTQFRLAISDVRPAAAAAHQRRDLRLRGQRHLRRRLLLHPAAVQDAHVERCAQPVSISGAGS